MQVELTTVKLVFADGRVERLPARYWPGLPLEICAHGGEGRNFATMPPIRTFRWSTNEGSVAVYVEADLHKREGESK